MSALIVVASPGETTMSALMAWIAQPAPGGGVRDAP